jgi:3-deoxy-D-manno-octulosonic-acid transferase
VGTLRIPYFLYQSLGGLASVPVVATAAVLGRFGGRWGDRFGFPATHGEAPIWVHAASVGEAGSALALMAELSKLAPKESFALSVATPKGLEAASAALSGAQGSSKALAKADTGGKPAAGAGPNPLASLSDRARVLAPPLDVWWAPGRFLARMAPKALIIMETELWPGIIFAAKDMGIPVMLAAGRVSKKSARRYRMAGPVFTRLLQSLDLIAATGDEDRENFLSLGADPKKTVTLGNPKFDRLIAIARDEPYVPASLGPPFVVTAGSTHPGEESLILRAVLKLRLANALSAKGKGPGIKLVLAPRHVGRAGSIVALAKRLGMAAETIGGDRRDLGREGLPEVGVLDVIGRLMDYYRLADLALVGGSFVPGQGHNPLEPAALGRAVVCGPNMSSFSEQARFLMDLSACKMVLPVNLYSVLAHFLDIPSVALSKGLSGKLAVAGMTPAAPVLAERLLKVIRATSPG